ncbi:hypothetical protein G3I40_08970 [Streptomyces sp. SID14478]|uniref:hypothetical protein n=1 Tax=Streptomyces sp. SID14478 TaxID=2706073 RepID=UPI0013D98A1C|nr:hypothetical protein [Streptomyces sp. SID14478]NEB75358.1 hypothetical protein [Streptomyces sp. SID14478]
MHHRPFFRWVLTLGVLCIGWSAYLYATYPDTRQIDLTVISEKPDGRCTVRWKDPYRDKDRWRESAYLCSASRDASLKPSAYILGTAEGWDSGFMYTEGPHKGGLEPSLDEKNPYALSDTLVLIGLALTGTGLVGGNVRAWARLNGARPRTVARAQKLYEAAEQVARDHAQACDAVRTAWDALRRERLDTELSATPLSKIPGAPGGDAAREMEAAGARTARDVLDAGVLGLQHMGVWARTRPSAPTPQPVASPTS